MPRIGVEFCIQARMNSYEAGNSGTQEILSLEVGQTTEVKKWTILQHEQKRYAKTVC